MFSSTMLNLDFDRWNRKFLSLDRYIISSIFMYSGTKMENKIREAAMFKLGISAGVSTFPKFKNPKKEQKDMYVTKTNIKFRPCQIGYFFMKNRAWFQDLV